MQNLVLLCRHHHRLVHEGGFGVGRSNSGVIEFSNPAGKIIPTGPDIRSLYGPPHFCKEKAVWHE
jgi:hypothetical protein